MRILAHAPARRFLTVTPLGPVQLVATGACLTGVRFVADADAVPDAEAAIPWAHPADPVLSAAALQIGQYFAARRAAFDLPLDGAGNAFAQRVWAKLARIPYGATATYAEVAASLGNRRMARAVGHAVAANPLQLVVPCHRVVGSGGRLGGYAAGERRKRWLLQFEALTCAARRDEDAGTQRALW